MRRPSENFRHDSPYKLHIAYIFTRFYAKMRTSSQELYPVYEMASRRT
ncbi:hypothetical protein mEp013_93 [Escherichia phage mEp013]